MFQVFDILTDDWQFAVEYAHALANEHRTDVRIYRAVDSGQPTLLAIVQPVTLH